MLSLFNWDEVYPACPVAPEDSTGVKPIFIFYLAGAYSSWLAPRGKPGLKPADGTGACPVKFFAENKRSGFNWGD